MGARTVFGRLKAQILRQFHEALNRQFYFSYYITEFLQYWKSKCRTKRQRQTRIRF